MQGWLSLIACHGAEPVEPEATDTVPGTADTAAASTADTGTPVTAPTDTGTPPVDTARPDSDGDGVSDAAELAITGTDPAVFDGGCLPWSANVVDPTPLHDGALLFGDLDGDGDPDALGTEDDFTVFWYENLGGAFTARQELWIVLIWVPEYGYTYTPRALGLSIADLEGDGVADVIASVGGLWELRGLGGGAFAAPEQLADTPYDGPLVATDLDGDGDADVIGTNGFHELVWFENQGAGGFPVRRIDARDWQVVVPSDLDGDGDVDLAYGLSANAGDVGWYENLGAAADFSDHSLGGFTGYVAAMDVGDLDDDGDAEVGAVGADGFAVGTSLLLWENTGGGAFSAEIHGGRSFAAAFGDLDADGDADLVDADAFGLAWYVSEGGTLARRAVAPDVAEVVHAVDLDGDGRLDIAVEPTFSWYRNPLGDDSDGDGLTDDAEACVLFTDPASADTDGDGVDDGAEVAALTDPSDAAAHP